MGLILSLILIIILIGALPRWQYSRNWGYGPSGILGLLFIVLIALMVLEIIHFI